MPDHTSIYEKEAEKYHELISKQPILKDEIEAIRPFSGLDVVDMGAGTGRLSTVLATQAQSLIALDASEAMLQITANRLRTAGLNNWQTQVADHRKLPLANSSADLIISGWSISYLGGNHIPDWEHNIDTVIREMSRVVRSDGTLIIIETLGTGFEVPSPPDFLQPYYSALIHKYGFSHKWIRTDYEFDHIQQAEELTRFFFGDVLANRVVNEHRVHLPECAGIWWLQL
ncbi:ubiquinone/menaquinone biosynthesis C-methylase UbiE [Paenibacillus sp. DS2015]|uniref:class I SAM-dependent methyltransferase n=1 Tax=Paenibacillus sp. DS2015 TaxID=3373917 RepID=UPI003D1FF0A8